MASKKPSMIDALRAKHDPHYQLAGKVESLGKDIPIQLTQLHKTLSKSFAMQRKTLTRVLGLEKRVTDNETRISNLADVAISIAEEGKARDKTELEEGISEVEGDLNEVEEKVGVGVATPVADTPGDWDDEVGGDWDATTGGINGKSLLGEENYDKFADELQQEGTIDGKQLSPEERKEGFKKKKNKNRC